MKRIPVVLALVFVFLGIGGCAIFLPTAPDGLPHYCTEYWAPQADQLLPLMNEARAKYGPKWGSRIPRDQDYQALVELKTSLEFALDLPCPGQVARDPSKDDPCFAAMAALAEQMRLGLSPLRAGLEGDQGSGCHPDPADKGWLRRPDGGNPEAVEKALQVYLALKQGLDM